MMNLLTIDSLALAPSVQASSHPVASGNLWLWVAIVELVIIFLLLAVLRYRSSTAYRQKQEVLAETPDFGNILSSAFHAKSLYDRLIRQCHPDRFAPDEAKMAVANELSARIAKHKHNIKELQLIEQEILTRLKN